MKIAEVIEKTERKALLWKATSMQGLQTKEERYDGNENRASDAKTINEEGKEPEKWLEENA